MERKNWAGTTEARLNVLRGLLHYHERMMAGSVSAQDLESGGWQDVPVAEIFDGYADALREAIRCVKLVNGAESEHGR